MEPERIGSSSRRSATENAARCGRLSPSAILPKRSLPRERAEAAALRGREGRRQSGVRCGASLRFALDSSASHHQRPGEWMRTWYAAIAVAAHLARQSWSTTRTRNICAVADRGCVEGATCRRRDVALRMKPTGVAFFQRVGAIPEPCDYSRQPPSGDIVEIAAGARHSSGITPGSPADGQQDCRGAKPARWRDSGRDDYGCGACGGISRRSAISVTHRSTQ